MLQNLMSEGPETARKRKELLAERERLEQGMAIIVSLEADSTSHVKSTAGIGKHGFNMHHSHREYASAPTVVTASDDGDT